MGMVSFRLEQQGRLQERCKSIDVPVAVSEMLVTIDAYRRVLDAGAADMIMIDTLSAFD